MSNQEVNTICLLRRDFRSIIERVAGGEVLPALHEGDLTFAALVDEEQRGEGLRVQPRAATISLPTLRTAGAL